MTSIFLVVDDEYANVLLLTEYLKSLNINTMESNSGEKAILLYKEYKDIIDLVILDYRMPLLNGYETLLELKKIDKNIKSVLITAHALENIDKKELDQFTYVLEKPINFKIFKQILISYGIDIK